MGREVRRVPLDWQHPRDEYGHYVPLYDQVYEDAAAEWLANLRRWEDGTHPDLIDDPDLKTRMPFFWGWDGGPPDKERYRERHWTAEEATGYQFYETVSEGTPLSPVFASADELAAWLVSTQGYSEKSARSFVAAGWAPSFVMAGGVIVDGVTFMGTV